MQQRLTQAFTAARTAFEEASDTGNHDDLALDVRRESFFYDFRLRSVSKKWDERCYEFRPLPIMLEKTDQYGYVVRLSPFDVPDDVGPKRAAYVEFTDTITSGTPFTFNGLRLTDG